MKKFSLLVCITVIVSLLTSVITYKYLSLQDPTNAELIKSFYLTENAVHVSPHTIRKRMDKGDTNYTLVDVRSPQEYEKEHVVGAINIPAYKDPNTSISFETEKEEKARIIKDFQDLPKDKEIIVYCYSTPCMTGRKIGKLLSDNNIYVMHLGVGWNEWRYYWNLWNHDGEIPSQWQDYVASGKNPGLPKIKDVPTPCGVGELGC